MGIKYTHFCKWVYFENIPIFLEIYPKKKTNAPTPQLKNEEMQQFWHVASKVFVLTPQHIPLKKEIILEIYQVST